MTTVTSVAVGSTGQTLEGTQVGANVRESVVVSDPADPTGFLPITSTAPSVGTAQYGALVWLQGGTVSTNTSVTTTVNITSTVGVITSSIPLIVSQSTTPWLVSTAPIALVGTSQVFGIVSTQVISSIPFLVAQSTNPWLVSVTAMPAVTGSVNVSSFSVGLISTQVQGSTAVSQVTNPWLVSVTAMPAVTGSVNVSSFSVGLISTQVQGSTAVSQITNPWLVSVTAMPAVTGSVNVSSFTVGLISTQVQGSTAVSGTVSTFAANTSFVYNYNQVSTAGGYSMTTILLNAANMASTVIKASPGQLYGYYFGNMAASIAYVKLWNTSTATVVTTATLPQPIVLPIPGSSAANVFNTQGIAFSSGIYFAVAAGYDKANSTSPAASSFVANFFYS